MNDAAICAAFTAKVKRGIFEPTARRIPDDAREDRLAEAVAMTFEMFARYARRGTILPDPILVHGCRHRAHDLGRYLVRAGDARRARDVLDPRNYLEGRVEVLRIEHDDGHDDPLLGLAAELSLNPTRRLVSAIDLGTWLDDLADSDVDALAMRMAGYTLDEIGEALGCSTSSAFAKCRRLGRDLLDRMKDGEVRSCAA